jgi:translocation and assembly module TamB
MAQLKQDTISSLEESLNRSISYDSISPSLLMYLEIRSVSIETFTPDGQKNVDIGKIRVYYDLFALLKGEMFTAVSEIRLINSSFSYNQINDKELIERVQRIVNAGSGATSASEPVARTSFKLNLPEQLTLSGQNIDIDFRNPHIELKISDLFFELSSQGKHFQIKAEGRSEVEFLQSIPIGNSELKLASSTFELNGRYSQLNSQISSRLSIEAFSSNLLNFSGLTLEIDQNNRRISIRKIEDRSPWDFKVDYIPDQKDLTVHFAAEEFSPIQNITSEDDLYPYSEWLNTVISGTAEVSYNFADQKTHYRGQLEVSAKNEFLPFPVRVSTKVSGTDTYAVFDQLALRSHKIDADYRGTVQIDRPFATGYINLQKLLIGDKVLRGTASIEGSREDFAINSPSVALNSIELTDINLNGTFTSEELNFELSAQHGAKKAAGNNIRMDGTYVYAQNPFLELSLSADEVPTNTASREFLPEKATKALLNLPLFLTTEAYLTTNFDRFSFSLLPFIINGPEGTEIARGSINGNNERLKIENANLRIGQYEAGGEMEVVRQSPSTYNFKSSVSVNSVYYNLSGALHQGTTLVVRGNYGLYLGLFLHPDLAAFSVKMDTLPIPLNDGSVSEVSFNGRGVYRSNENWNVQVNQLKLRDIPQLPEESQVELSGAVKPGSLQLNRLTYSDGISTLNGNANIKYDSLRPFLGSGWINLANENESETYRLVGRKTSAGVQANIQINSAPVARFRAIPIEGLVSGSVDLRGTYNDPVINFSVTLDEGEYNNGPLLLETVGRYKDDLLELSYVHAEYRSNLLQKTEAEFDFSTGNFNLKGEYRGIFSRTSASANITLNGNSPEIQSPGNLTNLLTSNFSASLAVERIQLLGAERESWYISVRRDSGQLNFRGGPDQALEGVYQEDGTYKISLSDPLPVQFTAQGNLSEEEFYSRINNINIDMSIMRVLGVEAIDFGSGLITGDLDISGAPNDPEFNGTLQAAQLSGNVVFVANPVDPFSTSIVFEGKQAQVKPVLVTTGGRQALFSGGFEFDRWTPTNISIAVETLSPNGIHVIYKERSSGLNIDGYVLGTFIFQQSIDNNLIRGDLTVRNAVVAIEDKQPVEVKPTNPLIVDLDIQTGQLVEFLWPRRKLPVLQAFADTGQTLRVYFESLTETFRLTGEVNMKGGELYYFQRSFYIKDGMITFNEDENTFDPLLTVNAEIKEIDNSGSPVTISLIVDNEPLSSFTPRFESQPALSTVEIANILGANLYTQFSGTQTDLTSALLVTGDIFSQFSVVRSFEKQVKDVFNLDLFSLRTQMIQNVILERVLNRDITQNPDTEGTVGRYLDNTTLFLGKYLGNDLFFEALLQIQQEPITVGDFQQDELNFTMEVGLEWKTPLFMLNFSISPDFVNPLNSIQNTSLGLSWDYSY